ncbi:hypothetical protein Godav_021617 [Gossypium davidsonii]|uniref:Uncharacterized protein n=1 Tax=Gossypium davidsonii TaxID=34287 RepID=A0A7J8R6W8_GOSDV|nr:hypothetical protein [Gossypium davidsonii]
MVTTRTLITTTAGGTNGWWEGVILQEWNNGNYLFMFHSDNQWPKYVVFGVNQLRLHRTWFNGYWVPPVQESELAVEV